MQSTGHSSTQERSITSTQGFPITYVMPAVYTNYFVKTTTAGKADFLADHDRDVRPAVQARHLRRPPGRFGALQRSAAAPSPTRDLFRLTVGRTSAEPTRPPFPRCRPSAPPARGTASRRDRRSA